MTKHNAFSLIIWAILNSLIAVSVEANENEFWNDISANSGIDFVHYNGMNGHLYFVEMMGAGGALIDYDQDGDLDVLMIQGMPLTSAPTKQFSRYSDRLYRNDGVDLKSGQISFIDVTRQSGLANLSYGIGVTVGDINNDGWPDLYFNNFGSNQLLINHQGVFKDITKAAAVDDPRWSVSSSFVDIDNDGDLDLYVGNYVDYSLSRHKQCKTVVGKTDYCSPKSYNPQSDRLFENDGTGRFSDISLKSGITASLGGALGVISADFDGDGETDIYVANDGLPNFLWINKGNNKFSEEGLFAGVAVNGNGMAEASMGVDAADFDNDGDQDLFMTHMDRESNTLFINDGSGGFDDGTGGNKLASASMQYTGFGTNWVDLDNDGDLDLVVANGAVLQISSQLQQGETLPLKQSNQIFEKLSNGHYLDRSQLFFNGINPKQVSRGLLIGDLNNDGSIDLVFTNNNAKPQILLNRNSRNNNWIGFKLFKNNNKVVAIGSKIVLTTANGTHLTRIVRTDGSYASSKDPAVIIGLGASAKPVIIDIYWKNGQHQKLNHLKLNQYHELIRDKGNNFNEK